MILGVLNHEAVGGLRLVVLIELVELDNLDELIGLLRIGGIASSLQASRPSLIIGGLETEQTAVALTIDQETRMVFERLVGRVVGTETLVACVIVVMDGAPRPAVALNAKMIVAFAGEITLPCPTLKESLCKGDRSRNLPAMHLLDGNVLILIDILLIAFVPAHLCVHSE